MRKRTISFINLNYVAYEDNDLCGYSRSIIDGDIYIYVSDLLVAPKYRGKDIGRQLLECIYEEYPEHIVYVLSDVDEYYKKQGYMKEGSVFEVSKNISE